MVSKVVSVRKAKFDFYLHLIARSLSNPTQFWRAVNSNKNSATICLPTHVKFEECLVSEQEEICSAFNKHFVAAGHLFDVENLKMTYSPLADYEDDSMCHIS